MTNWQDKDFNATSEDDLWIHDKLIFSKKLGYNCGPVGTPVPEPGYYIVRPCVNLLGMGRGAVINWIDLYTDDLPIGHFWCEIFKGRHFTVDYERTPHQAGHTQVLAAEGFRDEKNPLYKFNRWKMCLSEIKIPFPAALTNLKYENINIEFIGSPITEKYHPIEMHISHGGILGRDHNHIKCEEAIVVWEGESEDPLDGYNYLAAPDYRRKGFFIK